MRSFTLAALLAGCVLGGGASAATGSDSVAAPPCTCRTPRGDVALGATACLEVPTGRRRARCVMVLNNTSWAISEESCGGVSFLSR